MVDDPSHPASGESEESRVAPRQRVLRRGRIVVNHLNSSFDVLVRDLSKGGAKLKLGEAWAVPAQFELRILTPEGVVEARHPCEKRWQSGLMVGARFLDQTDPDKRGH